MLCVWYINIPVSMLLFIMHNGNFLNGDIKEKVYYISINYWTYLCFVLLCKLICVLLVRCTWQLMQRSDYAHFGWKKTIYIVWLPFPSDILAVKLFSFLYLLYSSIFSKREYQKMDHQKKKFESFAIVLFVKMFSLSSVGVKDKGCADVSFRIVVLI